MYTVSMIRVFTSATQVLGEKGEDEAVLWLKKQGYKIVDRNVANKYGEIDIVAKKKGIVYFFEVKAGKSGSLFNPAENLTEAKIRKFLISVEHYVFLNRIKEYRVQGIVVLLGLKSEVVNIQILDLN